MKQFFEAHLSSILLLSLLFGLGLATRQEIAVSVNGNVIKLNNEAGRLTPSQPVPNLNDDTIVAGGSLAAN